MNVLMITGIFPPDIGGPASYVPDIASSLVQRGHEITVITLSDATAPVDSEYPFTVLRILRSVLRPIRVLKTVVSIIRRGKQADLLFVHGLALEAVAANLLLRKPLVQKIVGDLAWERARSQGIITDDIEAFQHKRYGLKIELLKKLRSFWVKKSDSIITPSGYLKKIVCCWGVPEEKITIIYNAVEAAQLAPDTNTISPSPSSHDPVHKTIVSAGRLVPWKGFASLIRIMEQLPEAHLQIIGEGPERVNLEALIRDKNLQGRVQLPGNVSRGELFAALQHADLFVLNSTYEGLPHIVLEALSARVPVIATNCGGTGELIQHGQNGLLIPAADEQALCNAIKLLLADAERCALLIKNGTESLAKFTWTTLVDQTEKLLMRVNDERKQRIPVLFLSSARYASPPDQTLQKKWRGLAPFFQSTVISFGDNRVPTKLWFEGSRCLLIPSSWPRGIRYLLHFMYSWCYALSGALTKKYRAIIAQSPYEAVAPALALLPWKLLRSSAKPKLIVEIHSDWGAGAMLYHHDSSLAWLEKPLRKLVGRLSLSQADAYRAVSEYCRSLVSHQQKPAYIFPAFTDLESFSPAAAECVQEAATKIGGPYFMCAGMLIYLKGIQYLIRAMPVVLQKQPQVKLVIAGQGEEEQNLRSLAQELGITEQLLFTGHLDQSMLAAYMKNCLAIVLPSLTEGLPRVVIEAQLLGKPVIASRVGGIPEIITDGETGLVVEPEDWQALAQAMVKILEDPALAERMGNAARALMGEKFNYQNYYTSYHAMVRQICFHVS
jgi:glycosyltransferase involved in cell wall biosynthesis